MEKSNLRAGGVRGRRRHHIDMEAFERVAGVFASINSQDEMRRFLKELLTTGEMRDITLRWMLLERLAAGVTQRRIAEDLKISLCKITRGSKILKQKESVTARKLKTAGAGKRGHGCRL